MNVATIECPEQEARERFLEYRRAVRETNSKADRAIMRGYREIMRGNKIIDINEALRVGGVDELHRPRLAVCPADAAECFFFSRWVRGRTRGIFSSVIGWELRQRFSLRTAVAAGEDVFPPKTLGLSQLRAIVPTVPPRFRPATKLENYHILWEAEWLRAPVDPLLLRHIGGPLFAVLAQWDLTPLERSVLFNTARGNM